MSEILVRPVLSTRLAFGLDWLPLISGRASSAAHRIARQRRATHIVLDGETPASFGYGQLPANPGRGKALHSAAQNMARLYPVGSVAAVVPIENDGHWLVAVHEGAVVARTDIVYRSLDQAQDALQMLQRAHPRLIILGSDQNAPALEAIAAASDPGTALRNTGYRRRQWLRWMLVLALCVLALALFKKLGAPRAAPAAAPVVDAAELASKWAAAASKVEQELTVHGVAATHAALQHVYAVPVVVAGWSLVRAACHADGPWWRCAASYDRAHRNANNEGLLKTAPSGWQLDFPTIDRTDATWVFHTGTLAPEHRQIQTAIHNRRHLQSAWQGIKPVFSRMAIGPARPVPIDAPLDAEGRPLPRPADVRSHTRRTVEFEGPLRSLSLLLPHTRAIGWRSFILTQGESAQPSLVSSRLRVTLHGDLYERYENAVSTENASLLAPVGVIGATGLDGGVADGAVVLERAHGRE